MIDLIKSLATPVVWVLILMVFGLILMSRLAKKKLYRLGRCALWLGTCILFLFSTKPVSNLLVYSLECQYPMPSDEVLSTLDIVAVLGGGMYQAGGFRTRDELRGPSYPRVCDGVRIFKRSGAETLAFSGGYDDGLKSEAEVMGDLAVELGVPKNQILIEKNSRTTMENGEELSRLLTSTHGRRIGLVTSALHIPRSVKVFRKYFPKDAIVPIPVNYLYTPDWLNLKSYVPSPDALANSSCALHEWIGMVWYGSGTDLGQLDPDSARQNVSSDRLEKLKNVTRQAR